jgi:hypothetical protein
LNSGAPWRLVAWIFARESATKGDVVGHDTEADILVLLRLVSSGRSCVVVPVDGDLIEEVTLDTLAWRRGDPEHVAQDPRFAIAIHRAAIDSGTMGGVAYE